MLRREASVSSRYRTTLNERMPLLWVRKRWDSSVGRVAVKKLSEKVWRNLKLDTRLKSATARKPSPKRVYPTPSSEEPP